MKDLQGNNELLVEKVEQVGVESKAATILLTNQGLVHHEKILESQEGIHNEFLKGIEQQEHCCIELKSGIDSVKNQIDSKDSPFDLFLKAIFGINSAVVVQMFFQKIKGGLLVSFSLSFVFGSLYLMGSYYIIY